VGSFGVAESGEKAGSVHEDLSLECKLSAQQKWIC
jgi:hypothetical protein